MEEKEYKTQAGKRRQRVKRFREKCASRNQEWQDYHTMAEIKHAIPILANVGVQCKFLDNRQRALHFGVTGIWSVEYNIRIQSYVVKKLPVHDVGFGNWLLERERRRLSPMRLTDDLLAYFKQRGDE